MLQMTFVQRHSAVGTGDGVSGRRGYSGWVRNPTALISLTSLRPWVKCQRQGTRRQLYEYTQCMPRPVVLSFWTKDIVLVVVAAGINCLYVLLL